MRINFSLKIIVILIPTLLVLSCLLFVKFFDKQRYEVCQIMGVESFSGSQVSTTVLVGYEKPIFSHAYVRRFAIIFSPSTCKTEEMSEYCWARSANQKRGQLLIFQCNLNDGYDLPVLVKKSNNESFNADVFKLLHEQE